MCAGVNVSAYGDGDVCETVCVRAGGWSQILVHVCVCMCGTERRILAQPEWSE